MRRLNRVLLLPKLVRLYSTPNASKIRRIVHDYGYTGNVRLIMDEIRNQLSNSVVKNTGWRRHCFGPYPHDKNEKVMRIVYKELPIAIRKHKEENDQISCDVAESLILMMGFMVICALLCEGATKRR